MVANPNKVIGYFTMEIGIDDSIPTYCGGLGMLAGDTIKAAADLGLPLSIMLWILLSIVLVVAYGV